MTLPAAQRSSARTWRSCYLSRDYAAALVTTNHRRIRPNLPEANVKVERSNRILNAVRAYAETYTLDVPRNATYQGWAHRYCHRRPHTSRGGLTPNRSSTQPSGGRRTSATQISDARLSHRITTNYRDF
ncbi:integrase core domain-containing protein [Microbacterium sp. YY-03]|uniref:integrase core domain-containing protein n=1 Tax=Microbacterium sp. YY-03 TaxID=3421636 RepID=UPI003D1717E1